LDNSSFSFLQHHLHLSEVTSTNDVAKQLAAENLVKQGYVITTDYQLKGRGQETNGWESERGKNILSSIVLSPDLAVEHQIYLNLAIALGVVDFVKLHCPNEDVLIKWPNDIYVNGKKVAGILIENSVQGSVIKQAIIGIGMNINQETFSHPKATSLKLIGGVEFNLEKCIQELLPKLEYRYQQLMGGYFTQLWTAYHDVFYRKDAVTRFEANAVLFDGIPKGIDSAGRLMVLVENHIRTFNVKEIIWK
jgi:BirA family transcriptional regulator, biotin operon repressor / biotin---[acetyl-CoA-carboxylase] ligase